MTQTEEPTQIPDDSMEDGPHQRQPGMEPKTPLGDSPPPPGRGSEALSATWPMVQSPRGEEPRTYPVQNYVGQSMADILGEVGTPTAYREFDGVVSANNPEFPLRIVVFNDSQQRSLLADRNEGWAYVREGRLRGLVVAQYPVWADDPSPRLPHGREVFLVVYDRNFNPGRPLSWPGTLAITWVLVGAALGIGLALRRRGRTRT